MCEIAVRNNEHTETGGIQRQDRVCQYNHCNYASLSISNGFTVWLMAIMIYLHTYKEYSMAVYIFAQSRREKDRY